MAALLLGLIGCGSPANNGALFSNGGTGPVGFGGSASESGGGSGNSSAGGGSGAPGDSGSAGALPSGGMGAGGNPSAGAPNGGSAHGGSPTGGAPSGGSPAGGAPNGGSSNGGSATGGAPNGGGGSGGMHGDCSAFGADAVFYSETAHCYLVVRDLATFADAKTHCSSLGAHLVTLSNQQENDFVWSLDTNEHWIGATDGKSPKEQSPGTYAWVDGEPFTYTDWSEGQPNASQTTCGAGSGGGNCYEHCGFQWSGGAVPGEWNDRLCTHMIEAVCEWDD